MTALVTGATGFIGSAVVRQLLARGETVRVLARPNGDRRNLEGLAVEIVEGDLRDAEARRHAVRGIRSLYHVAADYRLWTRDPLAMAATNVDAAVSLVRDAVHAGAVRVVYTSSVATLGLPAGLAEADESTAAQAGDVIGDYKRTKCIAEQKMAALVRDEGLPIVIVNPSFPVGPRDVKPTPTGRTIIEAAAGRMPAFVDTGVNLVHVDDVARGHLLAHDRGGIGERYILGGENLSLQEMLGRIAAMRGRRPPTIRIPAAAVLPFAYMAEFAARLGARDPFVTVSAVKLARKRMFFSSAKARRDLGYAARPADEALQDAIAWFAANGRL